MATFLLFKVHTLYLKVKAVGWITLFHFYLNPLKKGKEIACSCYGQTITIRQGSHDLWVAMQTLGVEFATLKSIFPADFNGIIIDAGGYIGTAALAFRVMYPNSRIISLEPSTKNLQLLQKNVHGKHIEVLQLALGTKTGTVALSDPGDGEWSYNISTPANFKHLTLETIPCTTIDEFKTTYLNHQEISILKLDIEGAERDIFLSNSPALQSVPVVVVELHERLQPGTEQAFYAFNQGRYVLNNEGEKYISLKAASFAH